jgi:phosphoribosylformylglycinamidine synthase
MVIPGGFTYGDDISAGKVLANELRLKLREDIMRFVSDGGLILGICNGFQVLLKAGILPEPASESMPPLTLAANDSGRFEDRWVYLRVNPDSPCIFTKNVTGIYLPVRHGEGKFVTKDKDILERLHRDHQVVAEYCHEDFKDATMDYPANPNGAIDGIAGICNETGRIFGLMPHPEAYLDRTNHPRWTREDLPEEGMGLALFKNACRFIKENILNKINFQISF